MAAGTLAGRLDASEKELTWVFIKIVQLVVVREEGCRAMVKRKGYIESLDGILVVTKVMATKLERPAPAS